MTLREIEEMFGIPVEKWAQADIEVVKADGDSVVVRRGGTIHVYGMRADEKAPE